MKESRTPTTNAAQPGFLAALTAITRHEDFSVAIEVEESRLRVRIQVLGHEPLEAVGPPAALDAQLPAAIAEYAAWIDNRLAQDEVKIDLPHGAGGGEPVRDRAQRTQKKAVAKKKRRARKPVRKVAPKRVAPRTRVTSSNMRIAASTAKPGKAECIADYRTLKAKHGDKLTRRLFVKEGTTGRRYEKLWGNSWPAFEKEADASKASAGKAASSQAAPQPGLQLPTGKKTSESAPPTKKAGKPRTPNAAPKQDRSRDIKDAARAGPWTVKAGKKTLGATIFEKKPGDAYNCTAGAFTVKAVDQEKREIQVEPAGGAKPADQPEQKVDATTVPAEQAPKQDQADEWPFPTGSNLKETT